MQDLNSKYQATKVQIKGNLELLKGILNNQQFFEIKNFLDEKYKSAIPAAMNKANGRFNKRDNRQRQPRSSWKPRQGNNKGRPIARPNNKKGQHKQTLTALLAQLD